MNAATQNAINNSGTIHRNGAFNANNIAGSTIKNDGIFNIQGDLFINAFGLPGWFVENLSGGTINNNAGQTWTFPIPGSFYTQNKLVCENFIFQFIDDECNGDRIFCLDEDMSIIVFEK
jgi:hypothetical protein